MTPKTPSKAYRLLRTMHESVPVETRLCSEVLELLWSCYLWKTVSIDSEDALENMKALKFVQLLVNDIILRLCKFRETDARSLSFDQVFKELRKRAASKDRVTGLETELKEYRRRTINLENHRDTYIAHLSKRDHTHLDPPVEILDTIRLAVRISDILAGSRNAYKVLNIDLRAEALGEAVAERGAVADWPRDDGSPSSTAPPA
jgi:hypothetical protein